MIEEIFRAEWGRVFATLSGLFGDIDLAEEATQEAFAIAAEKWPKEGLPDRPGAWLTTVARRRVLDRLRRDRLFAAKAHLLAVSDVEEATMAETAFPDERLELIFLCCHPALAEEAVRLGRMLAALMPDEPEVLGLLALMQCAHARRAAIVTRRSCCWISRTEPVGTLR
ncbi:DUF6596 domain-containing protein [Nocardia sp. NPDC127579]|uniref:DUF6596 domain-containing protein n=1 Tax=Nocardia sp. NPDC127579 TaxID=3345402 RepID=UPI003643F3F1